MRKIHYKTKKLRINCSKSDEKRLKECDLESARLWNFLVDENKKLFELEGKTYSKYHMHSIVKEFQSSILCSNSKRFVANKLSEAFNAIRQARKAGRTDLLYPYRHKKYYNSEWSDGYMKFDYQRNIIYLTTTQYIDEQGKKRNGKQIKFKFKTSIPQNIKTLKLLYEYGHYYAAVSYLVEVEEKIITTNNTSSIDLGEIHAITSIDNNNNQLIITGRKIRSIKQFRNKKQAELYTKMSKCKKFSRQWWKYKRALNYIKSKTRRQLDYHIHKLTRMYTNWAVEKGISTVYCGDVTGIEYGTNDKGNSVTRQKINQWEYGKIMKLLEYKLGLEGVKFYKVNEQYSSQICPCCGFKNKSKSRNYKCDNCNEVFHRDIVGAWNILNFNHKLDFVPEGKLKYLRIV